ncbi:hypothetical protein EP331_00695 [bacterium]|nr:MAG: hypothetical protein EP331_00695 [bacterium]
MDTFRSFLKSNFSLVLLLSIIAACTGAKEAATSTSKIVYPSFTKSATEWAAHANFPASDSAKAVQGAKDNALLLLNEQMVKELDNLRKKSVKAGNSSLDSKSLTSALAGFTVKDAQVSNWDVAVHKKGSVFISQVTASMKTQDIIDLLKNSKGLKSLVDDAGITTALIPAIQ